MEHYHFKYRSIGHSEVGVGFVGIALERDEGTQFMAMLSVEDAKRLMDDLKVQVRIADDDSS